MWTFARLVWTAILALSLAGAGSDAMAMRASRHAFQLFADAIAPAPASPVDDAHLLEKQKAFLHSEAPELMMSGAFGCGKSYALCLKVYDLAQRHPGNRVGLFRATLKSLRATTLRTLLDGDGQLPPVIPPSAVARHNKAEQTVYLRNGSEVIYGGTQSSSNDKTWFNSLNLGGAGVDQAEELSQDEWQLLQGRLRLSLPGLERRQIFGACNPRHPGHWIYRRFFAERPAGAAVIKTKTFDNPHLPPDYVARLKQFTGLFYQRFVLGEWVGLEGLVYDNFDPTIHVIDRFELAPDWPRYRAIDFGFKNPFVCQWWVQVPADNPARLPEGAMVLYREIYMTGRRTSLHGQQIRELSLGEPVKATFADHDANGRAELNALGVSTRAARKETDNGLQVVRRWLGNEPADPGDLDGEKTPPLLYFFRDALVERDVALTIDAQSGEKKHAPVCTADEFSFYRWPQRRDGQPVKEQPIKEHDHGMDALRYLLHTLETPGVRGRAYIIRR